MFKWGTYGIQGPSKGKLEYKDIDSLTSEHLINILITETWHLDIYHVQTISDILKNRNVHLKEDQLKGDIKMKNYQNNYNVRDAKGRFVKKDQSTPVATTSSLTKEDYLKVLREKDVVVQMSYGGKIQMNIVSLQPSYLTGYVGKGTSKKASDDVIFAYDIDENKFKKLEISKITSFVPI